MTWIVKTELVNPDTWLRKVFATFTDATDIENITVRTFFVKARMKTDEEKKKVWDEIYRQYQESTKPVVDTVAGEGKQNLEGRVP